MKKASQGTTARQFWSATQRGQIGPELLYERQKEVILGAVLPLLESSDRLLDIGCADGQFSLLYAQKVAEVRGIDLGSELIRQARDQAAKTGAANVQFEEVDIFEFETSERFEAVSLMGVLTTIADDLSAARVLLRAAEVLSDDGVLILKDSVLVDADSSVTVATDSYEAVYRTESSYLALVRSLGFELLSRHPLLTMDNYQQTSILYVFRHQLPKPVEKPHSGLRVACYGSMPFHFRSLRPLSACFEKSLLSLDIAEVMAWQPDVIAVADGWSVEFWRDYCDAHGATLVAMRHGSVTRYGFAEPQYNLADYMCGSGWDIEDTLLSGVRPRQGFLLTGNAWVDQVFRLPKRVPVRDCPTILFAPTYNPELSAAVYFGERLVPLIRQVFPTARIIIKPHPAIVQYEHAFVVEKERFRDLMAVWRMQAASDSLVELIDDPEASIADSFAEADILVADRSSLLFEFMALDRPILLYSSEKRVEHWEYNPSAPGNAWRDIGLEFQDDVEFLSLLGNVFDAHERRCRKAQLERTQALHGRYQDGLSTQRVASAIANLPRVTVVINGYNEQQSQLLAENVAREWPSVRVVLIGQTLDRADVTSYANLLQWTNALEKQGKKMGLFLLLEGHYWMQPGSFHPLSIALAESGRGTFRGRRHILSAAVDTAMEDGGEAGWLRERLSRVLGRTCWQLVTYDGLIVEVAQLRSQLSEAAMEVWWHSLTTPTPASTNPLYVTPGPGVTKLVGSMHYLFGEESRLSITSDIRADWYARGRLRLHLAALEQKNYSHFPVGLTFTVNGQVLEQRFEIAEATQAFDVFFAPDAQGRAEVGIFCNGSFPGMQGLVSSISLAGTFDEVEVLPSAVESDQAERPLPHIVRLTDDLAESLTAYQIWSASRHFDIGQKALIAARDAGKEPRTQVLVVLHGNVLDAELLARTLSSIGAQLYPVAGVVVMASEGQGPTPTAADQWLPVGSWRDLPQVLESTGARWFMVMEAGDVLAEHACLLIADHVQQHPEWQFCYVDEDVQLDGVEYTNPLFKPDINLDLLRSYPYIGPRVAIAAQSYRDLQGFADDIGELGPYDFAFRVVEAYGLDAVGHIPEVLIHAHCSFGEWVSRTDVQPFIAPVVSRHLERLNVPHEIYAGALSVINRIAYGYSGEPKISLIIPTKDQLFYLRRCIESIFEKTSYSNYEIIIVDNGSTDAATCEWLQGIRDLQTPQLRVIDYPKVFNYSAMNNLAVEHSSGDYLILLNNDTEVIQPDWIQALLNHARRPEVGVVGAKLHFPDGRIQHAGVVLGLDGPADHAFIGLPADDPGYMHRMVVDQNYLAVTAACLMVPRSLYLEVGGLDEGDFRVSYNDVDFCLKIRQAGYLCVWTPYAVLMHEGSVSQREVDKSSHSEKVNRFTAEQLAMYDRWLPVIANDPSYNRNLALTKPGFELDPREAGWKPMVASLSPRILAMPADDSGCGHYRIYQPFKALRERALIEGGIGADILSPAEIDRIAPDTIVLQRQILDEQIDMIQRLKRYSTAFRVFELDDYLPNLPLKSVHREHMPKDILKSLRRALSLVDRFVVSTDALAEQFADLHSDIRVVNNRLPIKWWGSLTPHKAAFSRPRVGWAGGIGHQGDLELIHDVVRDLANEVDWIFLGYCPESLRRYVKEFHHGVQIEQYPQRLADLALDLAIAPLEDNVFNACKSNLRLLEYGACGYPVVCSDVRAYAGSLDVVRVKNRYKNWVEAIRAQVSDLPASRLAGQRLRAQVMGNWLLDEKAALAWQAAWLPS